MGGFWRRIRTAINNAIRGARGRRRHVEPARSTAGGPAYDLRKLVAALEHPNPDVRVGAAHELGAFGSDPNSDSAAIVVPALISALGDPDPSVRSSVALSLGQCGAAAAGAIPALIATLAEADDDVRSSAGIALEDVGEAARVPLEEALTHPDPRIRTEAEAILSLMGQTQHPHA